MMAGILSRRFREPIKRIPIRTLNIDEPLTRIQADGTVRHYVRDALGSVIALTDDTGVVETTYTYDPFGNVIDFWRGE